jgi:aminoglycoside 2'-N-acetyltransferase I
MDAMVRGRMADVRTAHTAYLQPSVLAAARSLLDDVFAGEMTDADWEHALGGIHALAWERDTLVGHGSVIQRRLWLGGRALRTGYVEGIGVRADRCGRGIGAALMDALERVVRGAYDLGALGTTEQARGFYAARGWRLWQGPTSALTPRGIERTPDDDGGIYVLPVSCEVDLAAVIVCDWRDSDVW